MRSNWEGNHALQERLLRPDGDARPIVEVAYVRASDIKDTYTEWQGGDVSGAGQVLPLLDGGARLFGTRTVIAQAAQLDTDQAITDLNDVEPFSVLEIEWANPDAHLQELDRFTFRVDPDAASTGVEVTHWRVAFYRISKILPDEILELEPIEGGIPPVPHTGTADEQDITLNLRPDTGFPIRVGNPPVGETSPRTVVFIYALKGDGEAAGNVALIGDAASAEESGIGYTARARRYGIADTGTTYERGGRYLDIGAASGMPRFQLVRQQFAGATITFEGANQLELGPDWNLAPHQIIAEGQTPLGTSLTYEIREQAGAGAWLECFDGDWVGQDNTNDGGADLSTVEVGDKYDVRVTLTPEPGGDIVSPIVRRFGVQAVTSRVLHGLTRVEGARSRLDPVTLKAEITEPTITIIRDGPEVDYRDVATEIFSTQHLREIEVRVWIGARGLARRHWMLHDIYLVDDYQASGPSLTLTCVSLLNELDVALPPWDTATDTRTAIQYENQSLKAVYEDLRDGQIGLPPRMRGPGVENDVTLVGNLLKDTRGKTELDAIAFLAGGANIVSQGRVKFVKLHRDGRVLGFQAVAATDTLTTTSPHRFPNGAQVRVIGADIPAPLAEDTDYWVVNTSELTLQLAATPGGDPIDLTSDGSGNVEAARLDDPGLQPLLSIPMEEATALSVTPGYRERIAEFFVPWAYDHAARRYDQELRAINGLALLRAGSARINPPPALDNAPARWIPDKATAEDVAYRTVVTLGPGMMTTRVQTAYPNPQLELGDLVSVESDRMVYLDPVTSREVRGRMWLTGRVVETGDVMGTDLTVWIQDRGNVIPSDRDGTRTGIGEDAPPTVTSVQVSVDAAGVADAMIYGNPAARSFRHYSTLDEIDELEAVTRILQGTNNLVTGPTARVRDFAQLEVGQRVYFWALGYERADGTGAQSAPVFGTAAFQERGLGRAPFWKITHRSAGNTGTAVVELTDPDDTLLAVSFEDPPGSGTYVEVTTWTRTSTGERQFTYDYDISGGPVKVGVWVTWDAGDGKVRGTPQLITIQPNPDPEITSAYYAIGKAKELEVQAVVDADGEELYYAIRLDREPTDAEALAGTMLPVPGGGGTVVITPGIFLDPGQIAHVKLIATKAGGATPHSASVYVRATRKPCTPTGQLTPYAPLSDGRVGFGFSGQGACSDWLVYAASKVAMPLDDIEDPFPPEEAGANPNSAIMVTWGNWSHGGSQNPDFGNYYGGVGYAADGTVVDPIRGVDGSELRLESSTDRIYVRAWFCEGRQERDEQGRIYMDSDYLGPAGESIELTFGPIDLTPQGSVPIDGPDLYGNIRYQFKGGPHTQSVSYRLVEGRPIWEDADTVIPDDITGASVLDLTFDEADEWKSRGVATLARELPQGWYSLRYWWHSRPGGGGETSPSVAFTLPYFNRSSAVVDGAHVTASGVAPTDASRKDVTITVRDEGSADTRWYFWGDPESPDEPDPFGQPFASVVAPPAPTLLGPATVWDLTAGGTGTILGNHRINASSGKRCWIEGRTLDSFGTEVGVTGLLPIDLTTSGGTLNADGKISRTPVWEDDDKTAGEVKDDALLGGSLGDSPGKLVDNIEHAGDAWMAPDKDLLVGTPAIPAERDQKQVYSGSRFLGLVNRDVNAGYCAGPVSWGTQDIYQEGSDEPTLVDGQRLKSIDFTYRLINMQVGDTAALRLKLVTTDEAQVTTTLGETEILHTDLPPGHGGAYLPGTIPLDHVVIPDNKYRLIVGFKAVSSVETNKFHLGGYGPTYGKTGAFNAP